MGQFEKNMNVSAVERSSSGPVEVHGFGWAQHHPWVELAPADWQALVNLAHVDDVPSFEDHIATTPAGAIYAPLAPDEKEAARKAFALAFKG